MARYRLAGQDFYFPCPVPELEPFEITGTENGTAEKAVPFVPHSFLKNESGAALPVPAPLALTRQTVGWVGSAQRQVEVYNTSRGMLLKVAGGGEFFITPHGETISKVDPQEELSQLDREIITGPALVLALALRGVWSLHASAAMYNDKVIVFLGESRQGKSTLVASLAEAGWQLVSDDILPVTGDPSGMQAWPRFPQLKLPPGSQPGPHLPEQLPLGKICLLLPAGKDDTPAVQLLPPGEAVKALLAHTAGARLFEPDLLSRHLEFCARSAAQVPAYRLAYPHRRDALPIIKNYLESLC